MKHSRTHELIPLPTLNKLLPTLPSLLNLNFQSSILLCYLIYAEMEPSNIAIDIANRRMRVTKRFLQILDTGLLMSDLQR